MNNEKLESSNIKLDSIKSIFVREAGWVSVQAITETFITIGEATNAKAGKRAWRVVTTSNEVLFLTPAMIEGVSE